MVAARLLLVDDDPDILESLEELLRDTYSVELATNGQEALDRLVSGERFDCMLLDLMMPVVDGEGVLRELKSRAIHIPVLLSSARRDAPAIAKTFGVQGCLVKPYSIAELRTKIAEVVGNGSRGGNSGAPGGSAPGHGSSSTLPSSGQAQSGRLALRPTFVGNH